MCLGSLDKINVPNISSVRCIQYEENTMKVYKASVIDSGLSIPYKTINIQKNMRVTSLFTVLITDQQPGAIPKEVYTLLFLTCHLTFRAK
jgi:hypothetical protein